MAANIKDGEYLIDLTLKGGSGKASVKSPANVSIKNGEKTVTLEWNSKNYDYMEWEGEGYTPVSNENNAVFKVKTSSLDGDVSFKAETTAMSQPHLIEYTLTFNSSSLREVSSANGTVIIVSAALIALIAAVLVGVVIRRAKK